MYRDMREQAMKKGEEVLAIETTPSSCLSSLNSEDYGSFAPKEVKHSSFSYLIGL